MPNPVVAKCPICAAQLKVVRLDCDSCGTRLEGSFSLGRFHALSPDQLEFLETFIRARGNFKDIERELGISYPTVRSRLDAMIRALGFPSLHVGRHRVRSGSVRARIRRRLRR